MGAVIEPDSLWPVREGHHPVNHLLILAFRIHNPDLPTIGGADLSCPWRTAGGVIDHVFNALGALHGKGVLSRVNQAENESWLGIVC